ncbi:MAG: glycosyltransferase family 39 protein [Intrasporangium sp.]|uniref:glycosyltransferase family 39 protein n=1 Tax=Intrasporangium sp. TaxID=1925024 RepID=UPI002648A36C|nr:glycosyltransferase family 39 protein [Intrasporangium sp.]MDN5796857.1 glycosyltransferase family 39 protein [Intrasporangium sp.]
MSTTLRRGGATTDSSTGAGPSGPARRGWPARARRGPQTDARWARPALWLLLLVTLVLYTWGLTASGWANSFYSAAVQAGSQNWEAFLFGSSDAGNSITVDKPPASLWVMALSVRLFGLSSFAMLLPQALMGVGTVAVVYASAKRYSGPAAGLIAGAVVALTPVATLMFRFNNPDALLTLLMALAAWATLRAIEAASTRWLALAGLFIGFGFLTKALQVLLVLPALGIAYLIAAPTSLRRRITHCLMALGAMVLAAGWWVAIVELVPAGRRPYIGGSQTNSFLELTFGDNGLGRLTGDETGSVGGGNGWGQTGLARMFSTDVGDQVSWLVPSAFVLLAVGLWLRRREPRTDRVRAAYLVWGGWLLVTMLVFSFMAGIFHQYYTVALAPAIGALVGLGAVEAWRHRHEAVGAVTLAVALAAASVWGFILLSGTTAYGQVFRVAVLVVGMSAALLMLAVNRVDRRAVPVIVGAGLVAALAGPAVYSISTAAVGHTGSIVSAGPAAASRGGFGGGPAGGLLDTSAPRTAVVAALGQDAGQFRWVAAAVGSQTAAGLQLGTGLPVMAIGGFNGSDPSPTLAKFQQYVAQGDIHYFAVSGRGGGFGGRGGGGSGTAQQITSWVQGSFTPVQLDGQTFYDLTQPLS